jgi:NTP pyrophosphatase (non-canonical NTP hydrolase)
MTDHALRLLRENPRLAELAAFPFHFDLDRADHVEEVRLASDGPLEPIAGDDTGGTYFVCADGSVLYADSEGSAGIIGDSVDGALEVLVGLPGWHDYVGLAPGDGAEKILAEVADMEDEIRECYGIDAERAELRAALGLPERSPVELIGMLHSALLRTEPDFLLLNGVEGCAYSLLDRHPRPPLRETVLERGRADLALLREGTSWDEVARDRGRRALALRAAQYDRRDTDLALLRHLLKHEAEASMTDELRLAAVLVGLHGLPEDLPLLFEVRETTYDTWCGLGGMPEPGASGDELREWARDLDHSLFGTDPSDEPLLTWTGLALEQGRDELARAALIRLLDDIDLGGCRYDGMPPERRDAHPLRALPYAFEELGDSFQALRAQRLYSRLQDTAQDRVSALLTLARMEREEHQLREAMSTLARLRDTLAKPADDTLRHWRGTNLGAYIVEEHHEVVRAASADASLAEDVREVTAAAAALLAELSETARAGVRQQPIPESPAG